MELPLQVQARWVLKQLNQMATWARMNFKPRKSRSLEIRLGKLHNQFGVCWLWWDSEIVTEKQLPGGCRSYGKSLLLALAQKERDWLEPRRGTLILTTTADPPAREICSNGQSTCWRSGTTWWHLLLAKATTRWNGCMKDILEMYWNPMIWWSL